MADLTNAAHKSRRLLTAMIYLSLQQCLYISYIICLAVLSAILTANTPTAFAFVPFSEYIYCDPVYSSDNAFPIYTISFVSAIS